MSLLQIVILVAGGVVAVTALDNLTNRALRQWRRRRRERLPFTDRLRRGV